MAAPHPGRILRAVSGLEPDDALRPVLVVSLLQEAAIAPFFSFVGIWAVKGLGASASDVGVMFALAALAGTATGYLGGQLSDRVGRKPVIVVSIAGEALAVLGLLVVHDVALGIALVVLAAGLGMPSWNVTSALVGDLVPPARREEAYAAVRAAMNLGVALGPPLAGLLVFVGGWQAFLSGVFALGAVAAWAASRLLPAGAGEAGMEGRALPALRSIVGDAPFLLLLVSTTLGFVVYFAYETVLPVVAVDSFGLRPATWGLLVAINPTLVTLFQIRLTRALRKLPQAPKLGAAMLLMGLPYLAFLLRTDLAAIVVVILVVVLGEMLWLPTSQALAASLAPRRVRGAYMGAFGASTWIGWTIGPFVGLQVRSAFGNRTMWLLFVATSAAGAFAGIAAASAARRSASPPRRAPRPVRRARIAPFAHRP